MDMIDYDKLIQRGENPEEQGEGAEMIKKKVGEGGLRGSLLIKVGSSGREIPKEKPHRPRGYPHHYYGKLTLERASARPQGFPQGVLRLGSSALLFRRSGEPSLPLIA